MYDVLRQLHTAELQSMPKIRLASGTQKIVAFRSIRSGSGAVSVQATLVVRTLAWVPKAVVGIVPSFFAPFSLRGQGHASSALIAVDGSASPPGLSDFFELLFRSAVKASLRALSSKGNYPSGNIEFSNQRLRRPIALLLQDVRHVKFLT